MLLYKSVDLNGDGYPEVVYNAMFDIADTDPPRYRGEIWLGVDYLASSAKLPLGQGRMDVPLELQLIPTDPSGFSVELTASNTVRLSWLAASTGFELQEASSLSNPTWITVSTTPTVDGDRMEVTFDSPTGSRFYRL